MYHTDTSRTKNTRDITSGPGAHVYELPDKDDHNFIKRLLYKNIYCKKT